MPTIARLVSALDGRVCKGLCAELAACKSVYGAPGYADALALVTRRMQEASLATTTEEYPLDGKTQCGATRMPYAWRGTGASLRLLKPRALQLASFPECPQSLGRWSAPTGGKRRAELVPVGQGVSPEDYAGKDVSGKIALARSGAAYGPAVKERGALGIVTDDLYEVPGVRSRTSRPKQVFYGWFMPRYETNQGFCVAISLAQMKALLALAKGGAQLVAEVDVDAEIGVGTGTNLLAEIAGAEAPDEVVVAQAHICEPGANDNASGSAVLAHVAETLQGSIAAGHVRPPQRTIRFLWGFETYGTAAYMHRHACDPGGFHGALVVDTVGQSQSICRARMLVSAPRDRHPVAALGARIARGIGRREVLWGAPVVYRDVIFEPVPYMACSDHIIFCEFGVPSTLLAQWPDPYYHSNEDSIDKIGVMELRAAAEFALKYLWALANE